VVYIAKYLVTKTMHRLYVSACALFILAAWRLLPEAVLLNMFQCHRPLSNSSRYDHHMFFLLPVGDLQARPVLAVSFVR